MYVIKSTSHVLVIYVCRGNDLPVDTGKTKIRSLKARVSITYVY